MSTTAKVINALWRHSGGNRFFLAVLGVINAFWHHVPACPQNAEMQRVINAFWRHSREVRDRLRETP